MAMTPDKPIPSPAHSKFEPRALTHSASAHLDLIRATAAWAVMWGHLRAFFFVEFPNVHHGNRILEGIYFVTGFGHQAVIVFFVLSGFLISSAVIKRFVTRTWSFGQYAIDRASRLYIVLIPGLLMGLLWDQSGRLLFASSRLYSQPLVAFGNIVAQQQITIKNFIGNLLFLQTILCPPFGSNGPLWSLANEFWYYILFPLILVAILAWKKTSLRVAIPITILVLCVAAFIGVGILLGFPIWLAGCGLVFAYRYFRLEQKTALVLYLFVFTTSFSICLFAARMDRLPPRSSDLLVGLAFTFFLFGALQLELGPGQKRYARIAHFLSGFSYSLYVLHFPFLLFLRGWVTPSRRWQPDPRHLLYGGLIGLLVITYACIGGMLTEKKTRAVRHWMTDRFGRFRAESEKH